jgi:hypothetical protein
VIAFPVPSQSAATPGIIELPRYFAQRYAPAQESELEGQVRAALAALNSAGYWPAPLPYQPCISWPGGQTRHDGTFRDHASPR